MLLSIWTASWWQFCLMNEPSHWFHHMFSRSSSARVSAVSDPRCLVVQSLNISGKEGHWESGETARGTDLKAAFDIIIYNKVRGEREKKSGNQNRQLILREGNQHLMKLTSQWVSIYDLWPLNCKSTIWNRLGVLLRDLQLFLTMNYS